jgi:hypothetical protein
MGPTMSFLNVDFEVWSDFPLENLIALLEPQIMALHSDAYSATLELSLDPTDIDDAIFRFFSAIKEKENAFEIWNNCKKKRANIGIQSGNSPHQIVLSMSKFSLHLLEQLDMDISITIYAAN